MEQALTAFLQALIGNNPVAFIIIIGVAFTSPVLGFWAFLERRERIMRYIRDTEQNRAVYSRLADQLKELTLLLKAFMRVN